MFFLSFVSRGKIVQLFDEIKKNNILSLSPIPLL